MTTALHLPQSWQNFHYEGAAYDLSHLSEYHLVAEDSDGIARSILVRFSDHCFTRKPCPGDPSALLYRYSSRVPVGMFCFARHQHSLSLIQHLEKAKTGSVFIVQGENVAILRNVIHQQAAIDYAVIFNLSPIKGRPPFALQMAVLSAYMCDEGPLVTLGRVGFKRLMSLRLARKSLTRNTNQHRARR